MGALLKGSQFLAAQAFYIGQSTFGFCEPLRDALPPVLSVSRRDTLSKRVKDAIPLRRERLDALAAQVHHCYPRDGQGRFARRAAARSTGRHDVLVSGYKRVVAMGGFDGLPVLVARNRIWPGLDAGGHYLLATGAIWQGVVADRFVPRQTWWPSPGMNTRCPTMWCSRRLAGSKPSV